MTNTELVGKRFVVHAIEALDESGRPVGNKTSQGFDSFKEAARAFLAVPIEEAHFVTLSPVNSRGWTGLDHYAKRVGREATALRTYRGKNVFQA